MSKSGNPAKQASKATLDDVRTAAREGRPMTVQAYPHTRVTIVSTNEDEAINVVKALQPVPENITPEQLEIYLFHMELLLTAVRAKPVLAAQVDAFLGRLT